MGLYPEIMSQNKLLAYNKLAYSVTIEDNFESGKNKNALINDSVFRAIKIVEECGDTVDNNFNIILNRDGQYEFTLTGTRLTRFLADVYGHKSMDDLTTSERNSTPEDVVMYLADSKKYGIGHTVIDEKGNSRFVPCEGYSREEVLKAVRGIKFEAKMSKGGYGSFEITSLQILNAAGTTVAALEGLTPIRETKRFTAHGDLRQVGNMVEFQGFGPGATVSVFDLGGKLVRKFNITHFGSLPVDQLVPGAGVYAMKVTEGSKTQLLRIRK